MNSKDSMQFEKMISKIEFAQKTNNSYNFILQTLRQTRFRFLSTTVHQNSVLHFRLDVDLVEF